MASLANDQWQYLALAVALIVFAAGVIVASKL